MKKKLILAIFLPISCFAQEKLDTSKAKLLIRQGKNYHKVLDGFVITQKDGCSCKAIDYLTLRKKRFPKRFKVEDYYIVKP